MPILDAEPQIFPADLLTSPLPIGDGRRWWLIHTKPRQEKSIARPLLAQRIPYFLPQIERISSTGGRSRSSFMPLFSGYVFLYANDAERYQALATNRAAQVIQVDDQEQLLRDLFAVWRMIQSKLTLVVEERLAAGERVRVRGGVLAGIEGIVDTAGKKCRLTVGVGLLQQGLSVDIEDSLVGPVESEP